MAILHVLIGLALLLIGGDFLVKGAVALAKRFNIPTMVIGLTIVSFGTSAPELLVSLQAALDGHPDIAIGNVIGSNIANIALVLGLTAIVLPIPVARGTIRVDEPVMIAGTLLLWYFMNDAVITRMEGAILFGMLLLYLFVLMRGVKTKKSEAVLQMEEEEVHMALWKAVVLILGGCVGLVFGSDLLVKGATELALRFGVSEYVIGVTVVAFGTSVPELATSLVAAFKKELDISVGNLVGSNIFNIFSILGITAMVTPIPVNPLVLSSDVYWLAAVTVLVYFFSLHKMRIQRWKGFILLAAYMAYVYFVLNPQS
ncbi:MAG: calcium/sodium antiporter [Bacteroidetes bacterium]|jgi:cation:H+ antiporter|nr:calcium/sodium antiporter [Bacteroidota bacterium]